MARVFFVEEPRAAFDVSSASHFGRPVVVFPRAYRDKPPVFAAREFGRELVARLRRLEYDPAVEYVCIQGSLCCVGVSVAAIVSAFGSIRALLYDRSTESYVERLIGDCYGCEKDAGKEPVAEREEAVRGPVQAAG